MREAFGVVRRGAFHRLALLVLLMTGLTAGCTDSSDGPTQSQAASPTPLSEVDLTGVVAQRSPFCDALDTASVAEVLGGEPSESDSYESGQRAELAPGLRDVAGEYSCSFERGFGTDLRTARAWLFDHTVTPSRARGWVQERRADAACRETGELSFGDPGLVQSCSSGGRRRVTAVGLFGGGWLSCQATAGASVPAEELLEVTQRWCAEVAETVAAATP